MSKGFSEFFWIEIWQNSIISSQICKHVENAVFVVRKMVTNNIKTGFFGMQKFFLTSLSRFGIVIINGYFFFLTLNLARI